MLPNNYLKIVENIIYVFCFTCCIGSCKKLVDVPPPETNINSDNVYSNNATAAAVLTGIYTNLSNASMTGGNLPSLSFFTGLSGDELTMYSGAQSSNPGFVQYYLNNIDPSATSLLAGDFWSNIYPTIYTTNAAIENLVNNQSLAPAVKQQLLGEAKFVRAFYYFYLVNLYGDVPMATGTDYTVNAALSRSSADQVYQQIISDLNDAENLLSSDYLDASLLNKTNKRVRPTKWASMALLARVYLYSGVYDKAAEQATLLINNTSLFSLGGLDSTFLDASLGNMEAIWQIQPVKSGYNTSDAVLYVLPVSGPNNLVNPVYLSNNLINAFEYDDQRRVKWVDSVTAGGNTYFYSYKYKINIIPSPVREYNTVLRLGEQYLIRAEAEANGAVGDAISDLNIIRRRAGLSNYSGATDKASVLSAILHERQVELFTEWGHRWLDLNRTGTVNDIMSIVSPEKGGAWTSDDQLFPIPIKDLQNDQNLSQNPGY